MATTASAESFVLNTASFRNLTIASCRMREYPSSLSLDDFSVSSATTCELVPVSEVALSSDVVASWPNDGAARPQNKIAARSHKRGWKDCNGGVRIFISEKTWMERKPNGNTMRRAPET